ncbi:hypothetical protein B0A48_15935 [Cryoendolithus antarcticus]|uniref:Uncharacterized protein n=1 Tax=Cryoendolithus antarcticus TaxID=1507870 RepID=A0A1V8SG82_9PEZI|nr:hypothetical protein B0A48_15935 [Cryoendolithus antarcticus]
MAKGQIKAQYTVILPTIVDNDHFASFSNHFRTVEQHASEDHSYLGKLAAPDAAYLLSGIRQDVDSNRNYLQDTLQSHGYVMFDAWSTMSPKRRSKRLAAGKTSGTRAIAVNPQQYIASSMNPQNPDRVRMGADWLNISDLVQDPSKFLSLLDGRAGRSPAEWAPFDLRQSQVDFDPGYSNVYFMTLQGEPQSCQDRSTSLGAYTAQACQCPENHDVFAIETMVDGRCDSIQDQIEHMQTDPVYMHDIMDSSQRDMRWNDPSVPVEYRHKVLARTLLDETINIRVTWERLQRQCNKTCAVFTKLAKLTRPRTETLRRLAISVVDLQRESKICVKVHYERMELLIPLTRSFKNFYYIKHGKDGAIEAKQIPGRAASDELHALLRLTEADYSDARRWRLELCFRELEKLWDDTSKKTGQHGFDERLQRQLTDVIIADNIASICEYGQILDEHHCNALLLFPRISRVGGIDDVSFPVLDTALGDQVYFRVEDFMRSTWPEGRKDAGWFQATTESRTQQQRLWSALASAYASLTFAHSGKPGRVETNSLKFFRLREHVAAVFEERRVCKAFGKDQTLGQRKAENVQIIWGGNGTAKPTRRALNPNKRGNNTLLQTENTTAPDALAPQLNNIVPQPILPPIPVLQKSLDICSRMWYTPDAERSGPTEWTDIVATFVDAGCAVVAAGGSA